MPAGVLLPLLSCNAKRLVDPHPTGRQPPTASRAKKPATYATGMNQL
jgi:hypothetical protein